MGYLKTGYRTEADNGLDFKKSQMLYFMFLL